MRPQPTPRAFYRAFRPIQLRWADNDAYGHMNNAIHYQLFDTAVNGHLLDQGALSLTQGDLFLVVSTSCDYFAEIAFPDQIEAGLTVLRLGSSSVTYGVGLFRQNAPQTAAAGMFTHVNVDRETRRPKQISDPVRAVLKQLQSEA